MGCLKLSEALGVELVHEKLTGIKGLVLQTVGQAIKSLHRIKYIFKH